MLDLLQYYNHACDSNNFWFKRLIYFNPREINSKLNTLFIKNMCKLRFVLCSGRSDLLASVLFTMTDAATATTVWLNLSHLLS